MQCLHYNIAQFACFSDTLYSHARHVRNALCKAARTTLSSKLNSFEIFSTRIHKLNLLFVIQAPYKVASRHWTPIPSSGPASMMSALSQPKMMPPSVMR